VSAPAAVQSVDLVAIAPAVVVAAGAVLVLLVDLALPRRPTVLGSVSLGVLAVALLAEIPLRDGTHATFCVAGSPGVPPACAYVADPLALVVQAVLLASAAVVVLMSFGERRLPLGEYHLLLLASVSGAVTVAAARDLATIIIALEVVSLSSFALVALRRDADSGEAALTAFLVSIAATAVSVLGVAFVYAGTGTLFLDRTAAALAQAGVRQPMVLAGLVLVLAAPAFKLAAVPFHAWAPDTYVGAPLPIAAYLSVVSKGAGLVALLVVTVHGFGPAVGTWAPVVAVVAAATLVVGNLGALRQRGVVRLLAWSSIAQAGYLLVPLAAVGTAASGSLAVSASVAYLAAYAAMNLGAFAAVSAATPPGVATSSLAIDDLRGLARTRPWLGWSLAFFLACLAGLPPGVVGLVTKVRVLEVPVRGSVGWVAVVAAIASVVGLAYYLRFAAALFAAPAPGSAPPLRVPGAGASATTAAVAVALSVTVVLSVAPALVIGLLAP
jgi:NADH-quinone oxidoreductase subunit N